MKAQTIQDFTIERLKSYVIRIGNQHQAFLNLVRKGLSYSLLRQLYYDTHKNLSVKKLDLLTEVLDVAEAAEKNNHRKAARG